LLVPSNVVLLLQRVLILADPVFDSNAAQAAATACLQLKAGLVTGGAFFLLIGPCFPALFLPAGLESPGGFPYNARPLVRQG